MPPKNPKFNLKLKFQRIFEIGLILSIILLIGAFTFFPRIEIQKMSDNTPNDVISIIDIPKTGAPELPPPPDIPKLVFVASEEDLDDVILDDVNIFDDFKPKDEVNFNDDSDLVPDQFFVVVEAMPNPIGGIEGIQSRIIYPDFAIRAGIQGRVFVNAFVDEFGNVKKAELVKGIGAGCDEAAIEAVLATKFSPGLQRQRPVKVQVTIPILFKLN
jgi:protein TonB